MMPLILNYGHDIVMAFSPPVVGRLVKKGLQKGASRAPQDPPWLRPWCRLTEFDGTVSDKIAGSTNCHLETHFFLFVHSLHSKKLCVF